MTAPARLDLRGLAPPEPLQRALEAVAILAPGEEIVVVTERRPVHLLALLFERGCTFSAQELSDGHETVVRKESAGRRDG
jgi:TusA-related sulfurtransferase